jgi:hypothetical protein
MDEEKYEGIRAELRTRFELLPEELQKVIQSSDYQTKLFDIAKKNKWTYEQLGILEMETTMVLLGMINPNNYQAELASELEKSPVEITAAVTDIKTQVFDPIRASLMKLYTEAPEAETPAEEAKITTENEKAVLEKSGITLEEGKSALASPSVVSEKRGDILSGIENPPKSAPKVLNQMPASGVPKAPYANQTVSGGGMVANKLSSTVAMPPKTTDYSIPKMGSTTPPEAPKAPSTDPYKEAVE